MVGESHADKLLEVEEPPRQTGSSRRSFLLGSIAAAGIGAATGAGTGYAAGMAGTQADALHGSSTIPFFGAHQAGIATPPQAHAVFLALDLNDGVDKGGLQRMMRILTDDAARLAQGMPALADSEPELALLPARLTVTFGFGPGFVQRVKRSEPKWLAPLPAFSTDRLSDAYSHGDLFIQVASDDPVTNAHATRMMLKDTRSFATLRWKQYGFRRSYGSESADTTMRNLFGQLDGTANPRPNSEDFDKVVWLNEGWLAGGTGVVVRRINMDLDKWDRLDRAGREQAVGRHIASGAPLTGSKETDEPDFAAVNPLGFPIIPEYSHLRRARSDNPHERIFRRGYNYDETPLGDTISDAGLVFVSFQADIQSQFIPLQQRIAEMDLLNEWTTPVGSAVFAIPPGCNHTGYIGETLLA